MNALAHTFPAAATTQGADTPAPHNAYHRQCAARAQEAALWAVLCGLELLDAKRRMAHGEWLPWIEDHCEFNRRTATNYMGAADRAIGHIAGTFPMPPSVLTNTATEELKGEIIKLLENDQLAEQRAALIAAIRPPAPPKPPEPVPALPPKPRKPAKPVAERPLFRPDAVQVVVQRWHHTPDAARHAFLDSIREEALAYLVP